MHSLVDGHFRPRKPWRLSLPLPPPSIIIETCMKGSVLAPIAMLPMETRLLSELLPRIDESASHNLHQLSPQSAALVQLLSPGGPSLSSPSGAVSGR